MYIKVVTTDNEFDEVEDEWLSFEKKVDNQNITSSYIWQRTWWKYFKDYEKGNFGCDKRLCILFLYNREDMLRAIAPFCQVTRKKWGVKYEAMEFIAQQWGATYLDIVTDKLGKEEYAFIFDWLKKNRKYDLIYLKYIPESTPSFDLSVNDIAVLSACPEINVRAYGSYDQYSKKAYSAKMRQNINARLRKLTHELKGQIELIDNYKELAKFWDEIHSVSKSKEKDLKYCLYDDPKINSFLQEVYCQWNNLSCVAVLIGMKLIGYHVGCLFNKKKFFLDLSYDREYRRYGIGKLIDDFEVRLALKYNYDICMGTGVDPYKFDYKPDLTRIYIFLKKGNTLKAILLYIVKKRQNRRIEKKFNEELGRNLKRG